MSDALRPRVKYVIGPDGSPLTIADLPPPTTKRWVIRRKAEVVAAVRGGLLSLSRQSSLIGLSELGGLRIPPYAGATTVSDKKASIFQSVLRQFRDQIPPNRLGKF